MLRKKLKKNSDSRGNLVAKLKLRNSSAKSVEKPCVVSSEEQLRQKVSGVETSVTDEK